MLIYYAKNPQMLSSVYSSTWSAKTALSAECWWDFSVPYNNANLEVRHLLPVQWITSRFSYEKYQQHIKCKFVSHYLFSFKVQWAEVLLYCFCIFCAWMFINFQTFIHFFEIKWNIPSELNYTNHVLSYVRSTAKKYSSDSSNTMRNSDCFHFK